MPQCKNCNQNFIITDQDRAFYRKLNVPEPTWCPDCRRIRRSGWRNERNLFSRQCDFSKEMMVSIFPPDTTFPVYRQDIWFSDKWQPPQADYDPGRPFLAQWRELQLQTPRSGLFNTGGTLINSDYVSSAARLKDCYMIFGADHDENCYYSNFISNSRDCCDCLTVSRCELCYEAVASGTGCYNVSYATMCDNCRDCYFVEDCIGCSDCFFCTNLRSSKYCWRNQQLSEKQYRNKLKEIDFSSYQTLERLKSEWQKFRSVNCFHRPYHGVYNTNVSGDYIANSKNAYYCFDVDELEDCKFCSRLSLQVKDSYDYDSWGEKAELIYETISSGTNCYDIKFCISVWENSRNMEYCDHCFISQDCFGCVGLKKAKFCILNKSYPEKEYFSLVEKIKKSMRADGSYGEFFPPAFSPFPYNHSVGYDFYGLDKAAAAKLGFSWREDERQWQKTDYQIPDRTKEVDDSILQVILTCKTCGKNYKLVKLELEFYKNRNIPIPRDCFNCRHLERIHSLNPRKLYHRQCLCEQSGHGHTGRCPVEFETTYSPDRPEKVYCEECYQKEIY